MIKKIKKHKKILTLAIIVGLLSLIPVIFLLREGFFLSDDGEWMVIRFSAFYQTLRDGQLPPRFFGRLNHGYGYPIGTFLYPAFMYLAVPFVVVGMSFASAIKSVIILSFVASGIGAFFWLRNRFSEMSSFIGSLVYVYFPYHLYDLYVRGSVGELVAFGVLPFLFLAIDRKKLIPASLLFGLLILSHNTFALLVLPFLIFYTYLSGKRTLFILFPLGLLVSAFFWMPSLVELPLTIFEKTVISDWNKYFLTQETLYLVGWVGLLNTFFAGFALYRKKYTMTLFFVSIFLLSLFFASSYSRVFWQLGLLPTYVQFPWRCLILAVFSGSFLTAYFLEHFSGRVRLVVMTGILLIIFISALPVLQMYRPVNHEDGYYSTNEDTTTTHQEYMPKTVSIIPTTHPASPVIITSGNGSLDNIVQDSVTTSFSAHASQSAVVTIQKIYYPGWRVVINGKSGKPVISEEGYVSIVLPPGDSTVLLTFGETPLRIFADILSMITILLLGVLCLARYVVPAKYFPTWYNYYL